MALTSINPFTVAAYSTSASFTRDFQGSMSWHPHEDCYKYSYPCGHYVKVSAHKIMRSGGHTAPPMCPTCHPKELTNLMKRKQWNTEEYFVPVEGVTKGALAWLDSELTRVRSAAWL